MERGMMFWVDKNSFEKIAQRLEKTYNVLVPEKTEQGGEWRHYEDGAAIELDGYRTLLPPKYFFYKPRENLVQKEQRASIVTGLRACDLHGLELLKNLYLGDPADPFYKTENIVITADCTECDKNCFCTLLGNVPYAESGFDINITPLPDGYVLETGSDRAKALLDPFTDMLKPATEQQVSAREELRRNMTQKVNENNGNRVLDLDKLKGAIEENHEIFEREGEKCVSCSACTNLCPACFCFLLGESSVKDGVSTKIRYTDSCQLVSYVRVGGGHNPRKEAAPRFKNRFLCKFSYRPDAMEMRGCTGCGRCINGCQGGIDWRQVLLDVYDGGMQ